MSLWKKAHEMNGNKCDFITMYQNQNQLESGICLNLPLISTSRLYLKYRHWYYKIFRGGLGDYQEKEGYPPIWEPNSFIERLYFIIRDWIWHFYIDKAIEKYNLYNYDIYHFEWGLDLYRDCRFAKKLSKNNKPIICTYHGQDMRTRGVIKDIDKISDLNLTSEVDLLYKHPNINYLFLPFETEIYKAKETVSSCIRVCHSPTNRYYKGSDDIIKICRELDNRGVIEFVLIENKKQNEVIEIKKSCDIYIDQIHNRGGWGYGMSSVEALSMGLVCLTELVEKYQSFIPDHPFIEVDKENLEETLLELTQKKDFLINKKIESKNWVKKHHSIASVSKSLYSFYKEKTWIK
jgi:glycosyltransferase involved in cell wall biosynthesis